MPGQNTVEVSPVTHGQMIVLVIEGQHSRVGGEGDLQE
jgi:hypothetical protein